MAPEGVLSRLLNGLYWTAHIGSGGCLPAPPALEPTPLLGPNPSVQRSCSTVDGWAPFVDGWSDCCTGTGPPGPLRIVGFARPRSSAVPAATLVPAFAPASTRTFPEFETDLTGELETVVAPQAAVSSAAATRSPGILFIAMGITHRAPRADGLDAA
jgi:hypothetical protein